MEHEFDSNFEKITQIPNEFIQKGYTQAINELTPLMPTLSYQKGFEKGKEIGLEIGYYMAIVENLKEMTQWKSFMGGRGNKIERNLSDLEGKLIAFTLKEKEEDIIKDLLIIRAKMKVLCSLCEIKLKITEDNL